MDPIPRIHHLEVDIKKDRAKLQNLQQEIDGVKRQLSGYEDIFTHNFGGLDFGSTIPDLEEAAITVGTTMYIPILQMRDKQTKDIVVVKYIERRDTIDENLKTEIIDHRSWRHPNIVRFKEIILTPTHLAIVMEYASRGELYDCVSNEGRFCENKARYLFRHFIHGVSYCHSMSSVLNSRQNSPVGRPAYIPPEVMINKEYDAKRNRNNPS